MIFLEESTFSVQNEIIKQVIAYAPKLIGAIIALIVGFWIIGSIKGIIRRMLTKKFDENIAPLLASLISVLFKIALLLSVAGLVGIQTTSFVAVLGAASFALGMALQGSLANFAGGVLLIIFKPYKKGDFVELRGHQGVVHEIQLFNTVLKTLDNKTIILPNGPNSNGDIVNFSTEPERRVDMLFGIGYNDDIDKAKKIIVELIQKDTRVFKKEGKEPFVAVSELADSSVNFVVRVWSKASDYWGIYFDMQENVKKTFDAQGISIPYPQTDVHVHQVNQ